jgi:hypothetical protein
MRATCLPPVIAPAFAGDSFFGTRFMHKLILSLAIAGFAASTLPGCASTNQSAQAPQQVKAVYHITTGIETTSRTI